MAIYQSTANSLLCCTGGLGGRGSPIITTALLLVRLPMLLVAVQLTRVPLIMAMMVSRPLTPTDERGNVSIEPATDQVMEGRGTPKASQEKDTVSLGAVITSCGGTTMLGTTGRVWGVGVSEEKVSVCASVCARVCVCMCVCVCEDVWVFFSMCVCMHACMCVCVL